MADKEQRKKDTKKPGKSLKDKRREKIEKSKDKKD